MVFVLAQQLNFATGFDFVAAECYEFGMRLLKGLACYLLVCFLGHDVTLFPCINFEGGVTVVHLDCDIPVFVVFLLVSVNSINKWAVII